MKREAGENEMAKDADDDEEDEIRMEERIFDYE